MTTRWRARARSSIASPRRWRRWRAWPRGSRISPALAARHRDAVVQMSLDGDGVPAAFAGGDGAALETAFSDIAENAEPFMVEPGDYAELLGLAIGDRVVRRPGAPDSRIRIYGPLEARLTGVDRVVIGGLVEGVWPPDPRTDPWLSRPMRHALGLDLPERRIGLSAHDFAQLLGAEEVFLTRSAKLAGAPTVASRFLQRLAAVAGEAPWRAAVARGERYRHLGRSLDQPTAPPRPVSRPQPRPPRAARPTRLSVTEIEHWLRDPYTIYAKHILKLPQLDRVDEPPGAADRGSAIHAAVGEFTKIYADRLPDDPYAELIRIGRIHFAPLDDYPEAHAFWWPRYERIAAWFADFEKQRRGQGRVGPGRDCRRADDPGRRPHLPARRPRRPHRAAQRRRLCHPGLQDRRPAVRQAGGDRRRAAAHAGGGDAAGRRVPRASPRRALRSPNSSMSGSRAANPPAMNTSSLSRARAPTPRPTRRCARLTTLVTRFEDESTPYRSLVLSMWKQRYGTYDDLARVKEWSLAGDDEEGEP